MSPRLRPRARFALALCASALLAACATAPRLGAGDGGVPSVPDELPLDAESARTVVAALASAILQKNRDEVRRLFSFRELAVAFQPRSVVRLTRTLEGLFAEEMIDRFIDPKGRLRRLMEGLEVGAATVTRDHAVVLARGRAGDLRFHVAHRGGRPHVIRIE